MQAHLTPTCQDLRELTGRRGRATRDGRRAAKNSPWDPPREGRLFDIFRRFVAAENGNDILGGNDEKLIV